jgi:hypothetical protein
MKKIKKGSKSEIVENRDGNSQKQKKRNRITQAAALVVRY